jgi:hypothetical protein
VQWLALSIVLSIVLSVVLNLALRAFPRAGEQVGQKLTELAGEPPEGGVAVPWKAMSVASLVLTVALNLFLWVLR